MRSYYGRKGDNKSQAYLVHIGFPLHGLGKYRDRMWSPGYCRFHHSYMDCCHMEGELKIETFRDYKPVCFASKNAQRF